jgi:hypothetical protein
LKLIEKKTVSILSTFSNFSSGSAMIEGAAQRGTAGPTVCAAKELCKTRAFLTCGAAGREYVARLEVVICVSLCGVFDPASQDSPPHPRYLFARNEANRSFRINKTVGKMARNEAKRSQVKPNEPKARVNNPFKMAGRLDDPCETSPKQVQTKPRSEPNLRVP